MYNFTVDEAHTYFVGEGQWLVHNSGCNPNQVLFTQTTIDGDDFHSFFAHMSERGWDSAMPVIDIVKTPDGLSSVDNTRLAVAKTLKIDNIPAVIHKADELLPSKMILDERFGVTAKTWGQAILYRTGRQTPSIPRWGTLKMPKIIGGW